jgi:hypothetical protein
MLPDGSKLAKNNYRTGNATTKRHKRDKNTLSVGTGIDGSKRGKRNGPARTSWMDLKTFVDSGGRGSVKVWASRVRRLSLRIPLACLYSNGFFSVFTADLITQTRIFRTKR